MVLLLIGLLVVWPFSVPFLLSIAGCALNVEFLASGMTESEPITSVKPVEPLTCFVVTYE